MSRKPGNGQRLCDPQISPMHERIQLYTLSAYPDLPEAADLIVTLLYYLGAIPQDDQSVQGLAGALQYGWPDVHPEDIMRIVVSEPAALNASIAAAQSEADAALGPNFDP